jgi:PST family polysaccharide transporter
MNFTRSDKDLGARVLRGALFLAGARLIVRLLSLVNLIILARLLSPSDFGVASLAITAIGFLEAFTDIKIGNALIAFDKIEQKHLDTAFTINLVRGMLIAVLLFFVSASIARFMDAPALAPVLQVLSVTLILDGLRNPAFILYERNVDYSLEFRRQTGAMVAGVATGITAALYFQSYWAIIIATLAERVLQLVLTYWGVPQRPAIGLAHWRTFLTFNGWLSLQGLFAQLTAMSSRVLIGKFLDPSAVGVYTVARQLAGLPTQELMAPLRRVLFPAFSTIKDDPVRLRNGYRTGQTTILGLALPISLGLAYYAEEVVLMLLGERWLGAALPLRLLAPALALATLGAATSSLAMALRQTRPLFMRSAAASAVAYPAIYFGIQADGLRGAVPGVYGYVLVAIVINVVFVARMTRDSIFSPLLAGYRSFLSAGAMIGVLSMISPAFDPSRSSVEQLIVLLPCALAGVAIYAAAHFLLWRIVGRPPGFEENIGFYARRLARQIRPATQH